MDSSKDDQSRSHANNNVVTVTYYMPNDSQSFPCPNYVEIPQHTSAHFLRNLHVSNPYMLGNDEPIPIYGPYRHNGSVPWYHLNRHQIQSIDWPTTSDYDGDQEGQTNQLPSAPKQSQAELREFYSSTSDQFCKVAGSDVEQFRRLSLSNCMLETLSRNVRQSPNLTVLYLTGNELRDLPDEIRTLHHLELLHLGKNQFKSIPKSVFELSRLKTLNFTLNQLSSTGIGPIHKLVNLEELVLTANSLEDIPISILQLRKLVFLDVAFNNIHNVPVEIENLQSLNYLRLKMNRLTSLPMEITKIPSLTTMCVSENMISDIPATEMLEHPRLGLMCLHSNRLDLNREPIRKLARSGKDVRLGENMMGNSCHELRRYNELGGQGGCVVYNDKNGVQYDVLIVYAGEKYEEDKKTVDEEILTPLEKDHKITCIVDYRDFRPGRYWVEEANHFMNTCRKMLFVITKNFQTEGENKLYLNKAMREPNTECPNQSHSHDGHSHISSKVIPLIWDADAGIPKALSDVIVIRRQTELDKKYFWRKIINAIHS